MTCTTTCVQPSPSQAHCAAQCHQTFGTVSAFDRHRRNGACLDPAGLRMHRDDRGVWRWDAVGDGPSARNGAPQTAEPASVGAEQGSGTSNAPEGDWGDYPLQETYPGSGTYE